MKPNPRERELNTAARLASVPVMFAFLIGALPVLLPILIVRGFLRLIHPTPLTTH